MSALGQKRTYAVQKGMSALDFRARWIRSPAVEGSRSWRIGDEDIFERRESDRMSVYRSRLKLPPYRSVNTQRNIRASHAFEEPEFALRQVYRRRCIAQLFAQSLPACFAGTSLV